jgi:hypothetical protein
MNLNEILIAGPNLSDSIPNITLIAINIARVHNFFVDKYSFFIKKILSANILQKGMKNNGFAATECENNTASQKLFVSRTTSRSDLT